jgi:alpha-2-macroglobulin
VAHFASVRTDASGKASVGFKLPDNLTSWRVTYQAISPKAEATSGTVPVVVRLPFFVDVVTAEAYLATDRPRILARSFGAGVAPGDRVNFTVKLAGPVSLNTQVTANAFDTGAVELPALVAGEYTLTVTGEGPRGLKDALEKRFTVRDSNLRRRVVDYKLLQPGLRVAGAQIGLTTLTFTDYERGAAIQALTRAAGITGSRVEQRLARDFGERWLQEKFSIGGGPAKPFDAALYQKPYGDGGIAILPYADADPEVSAKLADLAPDRFDRNVLEHYFQDLLLDDQASREQVIVALYGLAALDKPVLATLRALAAAPDLTLSERLHLALALATIGDATAARAMFRDIVRERAETVGEATRIRTDGGRDDLISSTALAAAIAAKLGEPEATALLRYTSENRPNEVLTLLEELIAVKATIAHAAPAPVAFTYERGGTATRVELAADENLTLAVRADELAALSFKDASGKVGLAVSYDAPFRLADQRSHPGFGVTREYERDGNIVMVRLRMSLDSSTATGTYQIVDTLPSGLRAIERSLVSTDPCAQGPLEVDGQRVTLWAPNAQCSEIHYYARRVTPGDYLAEPAILQHVDSGEVWGWSDATRLLLK